VTSKIAGMRRFAPARLLQISAAVVLTGSGVMMLMPGAHAAAGGSATPAVLQQAWYWQNAYEQANPPVAVAPPATEPSGVPDGDLAVAYTGNADKSPSKMTALSFDTSSLTPGSIVNEFTFSVTLDTSSSATTFNSQEGTVVACQPTRLWPAQMPGDYTNEPTYDCGKKIPAVVNGNVYTFKIPTIAQSWVDDQNLGVVIVPDAAAAAAPFQLVFTGAKTVKATMSYTPGTPLPPATGSVGATGPASAPADTGGGATSAAPPPISLPGATTQTGTGGGVAPQVAPTTPIGSVAPAAAIKPASATPTTEFWLAGIALALVLLVTSLVLGDPTPAATAATRSRLDRVLRDRPSESFL
jgi:hypothetical protein